MGVFDAIQHRASCRSQCGPVVALTANEKRLNIAAVADVEKSLLRARHFAIAFING